MRFLAIKSANTMSTAHAPIRAWELWSIVRSDCCFGGNTNVLLVEDKCVHGTKVAEPFLNQKVQELLGVHDTGKSNEGCPIISWSVPESFMEALQQFQPEVLVLIRC